MVSKETSERVQLCQRYFDDMLARAHSANDDLQEASRKLTDALKAWEREFFSCDEPKKRARIADSEPDNRKGPVMGYDTSITCPTPLCVERVAKYGDAYKRVTDTEHRKHQTCEGCGGQLVDGEWRHFCDSCKQPVEPGQLGGLFVPHLCPKCLAHRRATDHKCSMCRRPNIDCCC